MGLLLDIVCTYPVGLGYLLVADHIQYRDTPCAVDRWVQRIAVVVEGLPLILEMELADVARLDVPVRSSERSWSE